MPQTSTLEGNGNQDQRKLTRELNLFDSTMLVVGAMIGSGIFIVPAEMCRQVGAAGWLLLLGVWPESLRYRVHCVTESSRP